MPARFPAKRRRPHPRTVEYSIPVLDERRLTAQSNLQSLLASESWPLIRRRPNRESTFDLRPELIAAELTADGLLRFRLKVSPDGSARPEELLEALALRDLLDDGAVLTRTDVELEFSQPNTDADPSAPVLKRDRMKKEMLINVLQPEECRIAIIEDGVLEELYVERTSHESYTGNIYKGKIVNLEPAIQAAFVDFSVGRNGFLARLGCRASILRTTPRARTTSWTRRPRARPRAEA